YAFPSFAAAMIIFGSLASNLARRGVQHSLYWRYGLLAGIIIVLIVGAAYGQEMRRPFTFAQTNKLFFNYIRQGQFQPLFSAEELTSVRAMQQAVPPGEVMLVSLDRPSLLDYARNSIYIVDVPCYFSLKPGMPCFKGPQALRDYLEAVGIQYLAYSYGNEAKRRSNIEYKLSKEFAKFRNLSGSFGPWRRALSKRSLAFMMILTELAKTEKVIFDDGQRRVLYLDGNKGPVSISPVPYEKPCQAASCRGLLTPLVSSNNLKIDSHARRKPLLVSSLSGTRLNS
ncbi:MAG: hypothetical protein MN733_17005, partial [Nitrososphaera sp.]|nr:hypothetical protein [Nitrososphaera sp.]